MNPKYKESNTNMNSLFKILKENNSLEAFKPGKDNMWTSEKFSNFVFNSFINPEIPGGGKNNEQIEEYVELIQKHSTSNTNVLDIGCGVGFYSEKLSDLGYNVTGVDISPKLIAYAKEQTLKNNSKIKYICDDIFNVSFDKKFDVIIILYKTYATFSEQDRNKLLSKIYSLLSEDGILILDVPPEDEFKQFNEINLWMYVDEGNILMDEACLNLISNKKYPESVLLSNTIYITEENEIYQFNDWLKFFTEDEIKKELTKAKFNVKNITSTKDNSLAIICNK